MALTYSARTRRRRIYEPPQTPFKIPCGTNVRKRKGRFGKPCCHYYYTNSPPLMAYKTKNLGKEILAK